MVKEATNPSIAIWSGNILKYLVFFSSLDTTNPYTCKHSCNNCCQPTMSIRNLEEHSSIEYQLMLPIQFVIAATSIFSFPVTSYSRFILAVIALLLLDIGSGEFGWKKNSVNRLIWNKLVQFKCNQPQGAKPVTKPSKLARYQLVTKQAGMKGLQRSISTAIWHHHLITYYCGLIRLFSVNPIFSGT